MNTSLQSWLVAFAMVFAISTRLSPAVAQPIENRTERGERAARYVRLLDLLPGAKIDTPLDGEGLSPEAGRLRGAFLPERPRFDGRFSAILKRVSLPTASGLRLEDRDALLVPPGSRIEWPLRIPGDSLLRFHLAVLPGTPASDARARVVLSFTGENGDEQVLHSREAPSGEDAAGGPGGPIEIPLSKLAGHSGRLVLRTELVSRPGRTPGMPAVLVANPAIVPARPPASQSSELNVLLIGVDTLRADHLSCYGYPRKTSPRIDRLAGEGIRFHRAIAPAPWTLPSFTSVLTSLYPSRHGAGRGGRGGWTRVHPDAVFLSEILYSRGYLTAGMVANELVSPKYGLDQGCEIYAHPHEGRGFESVSVEVPRIREFLTRNRSVPFFLFWHIMDCHLPYLVAPGPATRFLDPDYSGIFRNRVGFQFLVRRPGRRRFAHEGPPPIPEMSETDRQRIVDFYDAEISEVDTAVGEVIDALEELDLLERTVIMFTADHGEGLADHGHYHHGYTLYEDQVRVPLIVRAPGLSRGRVHRDPVSTVDVAPMILSLLDVPRSAEMQGVNRLDPEESDRPVFSEFPTYDSSALKAVYLGDEKLLDDPVFVTREAYDVEDDPGERKDLIERDPPFVPRAASILETFRHENLGGGRYHLRIRVAPATRISGRLVAGEVFDANAALLSPGPAASLRFDLARKHLDFKIETPTGEAEIVFWYRGKDLQLHLAADGAPLPASGTRLGSTNRTLEESGRVATGRIPVATGTELDWPPAEKRSAGTHSVLWMEATGLRPLITSNTEEELRRLRELGYVR